MALKTNVPIMYRTPYIPRAGLPPEVNKIMRKEVSELRKSLLRKQRRLKESPEFSHDQSLVDYLSRLRVRDLNTPNKVQNTWVRLRGLDKSNNTSVTGKRLTIKRTLQTLEDRGIRLGNVSLAKFGEFINWVKDTYGKNAYSASEIAEYLKEEGDISAEELQKGYEEWVANN